MSIIDKAFSAISPKLAYQRSRYRAMAAITSSFYQGASRSKRSLKGWALKSSIDPDEEILYDLEILRNRSRDLYKNNSIATGAIRKVLTNVVGPGLKLQTRIDREFLGLNDKEADKWEADVERHFRFWAENTDADAGRRLNFYEIQSLAFLSYLMSGEVFALLPLIERAGTLSPLRVQLIEADRVCNPEGQFDTQKIAGGIETGNYGEPLAYWIIISPIFMHTKKEWKRILAFGPSSGRQNVIHLYQQERPGQRRGVPYLTPVMEALKQLGRYSEAELTAALISSMFTVFVKSQAGTADILSDVTPQDEKIDQTGEDYELGPGAIVGLAEGEDVSVANPGRPNTGFEVFVMAILRQIGMALEIPYELMIQHFQASYSASRAALLEAWKVFKTRREWLTVKFCKPIYEEWLAEEVASGRISAPGFFDSVAIRRAYCGAEWIGQSQGQIDPVKETKAADMRVASGYSTLADETAAITVGNWERKIRQRAKEQRLIKELGLEVSNKTNSSQGTQNKNQDENQGVA